jgi:hypothetical protein
MITKFYQFSIGFIQQSNEIDDMLKKIIHTILINVVCEFYKVKVANASINIAVQLMLNCKWWAYGCDELESILLEKRNFAPKTGGILMSQCTESFEEIRNLSEQRIFDVIKAKIDNFMDLIDYDWAATTSRKYHSPVLNGLTLMTPDLVDYLCSVSATSLSRTPETTLIRMFIEEFDHLAMIMKVL